MIHPQTLLAEKIFSLLIADSLLNTLVSGIYENVPNAPHTIFPFIALGQNSFTEFDTHTSNGIQGTISIRVFDQNTGENKVQRIMNQIYSILHKASLNISGFNTVYFGFQDSGVSLASDGRTYEGTINFKCILGGSL